MATQPCLPELNEEEQLFYAVVHCPVEVCDGLLKCVRHVDIHNGSGRTLLHVAVRLGKLDWVQQLLSMGADLWAVDQGGATVLDAAEEMCTKYPFDVNRLDIMNIVHLVSARDLRKRSEARSTGFSWHTSDQEDKRVLLLLSSTVSMLWKGMKTFQESVKEDLTAMALQISSISQNIQSTPCKAERIGNCGDIVTPVDVASSGLSSSSGWGNPSGTAAEIGFISPSLGPPSYVLRKEEKGGVSRGVGNCSGSEVQSDVACSNLVLLPGCESHGTTGTQVGVLSQNLVPPSAPSFENGNSGDVTTGRGDLPQSLVAISSESPNVTVSNDFEGTQSLADIEEKQLSELKEAISEVRTMIVSRDVLLEALETRITMIAEKFRSLKDGLEEIDTKDCHVGDEVEGLRHLLSYTFKSPSPTRMKMTSEDCVKAMMSKTDILNGDEMKVTEISSYYQHMCSTSFLAPLLDYLASRAQVRVMIDCRSQLISGMMENYVDHDGIRRDGSSFFSFADFAKHRVYLGGKTSGVRKKEVVRGWLVRSLAQMAMYLAFVNGGRPYSEHDYKARVQYRSIVNRAEKMADQHVEMDTYLKWSMGWEAPIMKEIKLLSAVPLMIAQHGVTEATQRLRKQLPSLLDYYTGHFIAELTNQMKAAWRV